MNIIARRNTFFLISGVLLTASIGAIAVWGLPFGIDFTGGSLIEVSFSGERPSVESLAERLDPLHLGGVRLQPSGANGLFLRLRHIDEPTHRQILATLGSDVAERRFDSVGPSIGAELRNRSGIAVILVIVLIVSYIAWTFRTVSRPVASWKYGVATVAALVHDVVIPAGLFAAAGRFLGFEVDTLFVVAILTILGFSVHDTIVVFDRIRENLKKAPRYGDFEELVNTSVNQTFGRSINTSLTVVLALAAVYLLGGASTRVFSLTLIVGIIIGTYSSIFIASPLLVTWHAFSGGRSG